MRISLLIALALLISSLTARANNLPTLDFPLPSLAPAELSERELDDGVCKYKIWNRASLPRPYVLATRIKFEDQGDDGTPSNSRLADGGRGIEFTGHLRFSFPFNSIGAGNCDLHTLQRATSQAPAIAGAISEVSVTLTHLFGVKLAHPSVFYSAGIRANEGWILKTIHPIQRDDSKSEDDVRRVQLGAQARGTLLEVKLRAAVHDADGRIKVQNIDPIQISAD